MPRRLVRPFPRGGSLLRLPALAACLSLSVVAAAKSPVYIHVDATASATAPAAAAAPGTHAWLDPVLVFANPAANYSIPIENGDNRLEIGDVNGDGLVDLAWPALGPTPTDPSPSANATIGIAIALGRPGGGFEFTRIHPVDGCVPTKLKLIDADPDPGSEILFDCTIRTYSYNFVGFAVFDMKADGTTRLSTPRTEDYQFYSEDVNLVDVNQDGHEDLFMTYYDETATQAAGAPRFRYTIWYWQDGQRWTRYVSLPFAYEGVTIFDSHSTNNSIQRIDFDGDGEYDAFEGQCPQEGSCYFRQEPYRQLVLSPLPGGNGLPIIETTYGDLDGDGRADRFSVGSHQWEPGSSDYVLNIDLQTADGGFENVGFIGPVFNPGKPLVADVDLNGLNDLVFGDGYDLFTVYQDAPGVFRVAAMATLPDLEQARIYSADFNGDLCPDLLVSTPTTSSTGSHKLILAENCIDPGDLKVSVTATPTRVVATVANVAGARTYVDSRPVRVVIAPEMKQESSLGLQVFAPSGCVAQPARPPQRIYDCPLAKLAPGATASLEFGVFVSKQFTDWRLLHARAFLLDGSADANGANNSAGTSVVIGRRMQAPAPGPVAPSPRRGDHGDDAARAATREQTR